MAKMSDKHVANTLKLLADVAADQAAKYDELSDSISDMDSDDHYDSPTPIFDSFYSKGRSETIMQLTNFSSKEFLSLWTSLMHLVQEKWMRGRGRESQYGAKDVFFMTLVTLKNGGTWDFLGRVFHIKASTFERLVTKFVRMFSEAIFDKIVLNGIVTYPMDKLMAADKCLKNFPCARYAVDVTFQQANRPSGSLQEGKKYYSGKHKLYGFKVEVSVLPIGVAVHCTDHYPGSVADIDIFYKNADFHDVGLSKSEKEVTNRALDFGPLREKYSEDSALADKGYQGSTDRLRVIHPKRKPRNGHLTLEEEKENKKISSDRIIVENWFGRHFTLWSLFFNKWKWSEELYDVFFKLAAALTNHHVILSPLRAEDLQFYRKCKQRQYIIGEEIVKKRKRVQEKYRRKRKKRLAAQFCEGESDDSTLSPQ